MGGEGGRGGEGGEEGREGREGEREGVEGGREKRATCSWRSGGKSEGSCVHLQLFAEKVHLQFKLLNLGLALGQLVRGAGQPQLHTLHAGPGGKLKHEIARSHVLTQQSMILWYSF